MAKKSVDDEIDEIVEQIDEIEKKYGWTRGYAGPPEDLDDLRKKLAKLRERAQNLESERDSAEEHASSAESETEDVEARREALDALYQKALYVLGRYGVGERDLHLVHGHESPAELARKLGHEPAVRAIRSAIATGHAAGHQSCAYVGTCLDFDVGLADHPCTSAATPPSGKGRFGAAAGGKKLHAQCRDYCLPHSLGWISEAERCV